MAVRLRRLYVFMLSSYALGASLFEREVQAQETHVQPTADDKARSEALFRDGRNLMKRIRYGDACMKFAESDRLGPGIGVLLNLADCQEKLGKTATAWSTFQAAAERAHVAGDTVREKFAIEHVTALEAHLAKLSIRLNPRSAADQADVRLDGVSLHRVAWETPTPVDPGPHVVEVTAPGKGKYVGPILVDQGSTHTMNIELVAEPASQHDGHAQLTQPPSVDRGWFGDLGTQRMVALGSLGLGAIGIVTGSAFGLLSKSDRDESAGHCSGPSCDAQGLELRERAQSRGNVSTVFFLVGAAGLAGAGVLWFTAQTVPVAAQVGVGLDGVVVKGNW